MERECVCVCVRKKDKKVSTCVPESSEIMHLAWDAVLRRAKGIEEENE